MLHMFKYYTCVKYKHTGLADLKHWLLIKLCNCLACKQISCELT